ncbi:DnaD domain-containing protein, partial [Enterococcus italicus]
MDIGYIKLYRKVTSSFVWTNSNMLKLWILCLTKASHKGSRFIFNGQEIVVSSGQFVTGRAVIEKEFNEGVTRDQQIVGRTLWRWLKKFENEQMLSIKSTTKYSVITINKWDEYQSSDHQLSSGRPSSVQQLSTYKNEKNEINNNNNNRVQDNEEVYPAELIQQLYHQFPTGLLQGALSDWLQEWPREMINF